jgi:N-acetylneuraminic acid mutarotase
MNGKIFVAGGAPTEEAPSIAELDVYEPASDTWSMGAPMPTAREHVASCVIDNKFVVIGGWNEKKEVQNVVEAYDPNTNTWERWPDLPTARGGLGAVTFDGRCYTIGGETWATPPPATFGANEMFDPATRRWAGLAPMPTPRHGLGLAVVGQEIWAVGGGPSQGNSYTAIIEAYHP